MSPRGALGLQRVDLLMAGGDQDLARVAVGEEQAAKFKAQAEVYAQRLGLTRKELDRMSSLAKKYREEWMTQIGALTGEMGQVKQKLDEHGKAIEETRGALQRAIGALGEITGETISEELLDTIFSRFCVGK